MWRIYRSRTGSNTSSCADGRWPGLTLGRGIQRGSQVISEETIRSIRPSRDSLVLTPIRPIATMRLSLKRPGLDDLELASAPEPDSQIQWQPPSCGDYR